MEPKEALIQSIPRKIIAAAITSVLFAVLFALVQPGPFGEEILSERQYIEAFVLSISVYLMFSFPVILFYGSLTSIFSDFLTARFVQDEQPKKEYYLSLFFHLVFGLILLWVSFTAAFIYFLVDRLLMKKKNVYNWLEALKSLLVPFSVWLFIMGIIWFVDFVENWTDFVVW